MNTKHGVLCAAGLLTIKANQWDIKRLTITFSMSWLCEQVLAQDLTHLWIMQDTGISPDRAFVDAAQAAWSLRATYLYSEGIKLPPGRKNEALTITGWKRSDRGGQRQINLVFPHNTKWDFGRTDNPKHLLITLGYLEKVLETRIAGSPSTVGWRLIEKLNEKHADWIAPAGVDLAACHFDRKAAQDIIWQRPLLPGESEKKYLHKYDKNSAYLRECLHQKFGVGDPVHLPGQAYDKRYPGAWRITVKNNTLENLPPAMWDRAEWVAAPVVKLLFDTGHDVEVHEGWCYPIVEGKPHFHQWLKDWAELVWAKRQGFKDESVWKNEACREYARGGMKKIAKATVGMGSYRFFDTEEDTIKRHPEVKVQVVGGARATMLYNMVKVQKDTGGMTPVLVYLDALYYLSDEPGPGQAIPGMLDKQDSLGGYKNDGWTLPVTPHIRDILASGLAANEKLHQLNLLVKEQQQKGGVDNG